MFSFHGKFAPHCIAFFEVKPMDTLDGQNAVCTSPAPTIPGFVESQKAQHVFQRD